jgi:transcriptional regulator GlxA family with amidase domain
MQVWDKITAVGRDFDILLFNRFSNHCLANTVEPLRAANSLSRKTLFRWRFLTLDGAPVESSSGLQIAPHGALRDGLGSTLIVMPSYGFRELSSWEVSTLLRTAAKRYFCVAGLDTGSWLMAKAGLLDGYRATIHWEELTSFAEAFPSVEVQRARYVIDKNRITCSGAMAAFDLATKLIADAHGPLLAMDVAQLFMTRESTHAQSAAKPITGKTVTRAVSIMQANLENPLAIGEIARQVGCTQKTLEARTRVALNTTPQAVYQRLRLQLAHKLMRDTEHSVSEIAGRCGYENASAMTRAFKAVFKQTPRDVRSERSEPTTRA